MLGWAEFDREHCARQEPVSRCVPDVFDRKHEIVGTSSKVRELLELIERVAATSSTVLIEGESGTGKARKYLHQEEEAAPYQQKAGTFTPWEDIPLDTDMLFYEGLHGAIVTETVNVAQHADLLIGVVPVINLEWVQKLHRDKMVRGYTQEAVVDTILRRMPDYINYICPQFSQTHVNFQRVPTVDTSNPFIARDVPSPDESMLIIRFKDAWGIDFPYLLSMLPASFMSRPNTIVCPGSKMPLAMQLIFTPMIWQLMDRKFTAVAQAAIGAANPLTGFSPWALGAHPA